MNKEQFAELLESIKALILRTCQPILDRVKAVEPWGERLSALEQWKAANPVGPKGQDGKDADPALISIAVAKAVALIPAPRDGVDGRDGSDGIDGKSVDPEAVQLMVRAAVDALPKPADGRDGVDGKDGQSVDMLTLDATIRGLVAEGVARALPDAVTRAVDALMPQLVEKAAALVPRPADGKDGANGIDGKSADLAEVEAMVRKHIAAIPAPKDGADGKSIDPQDVQAMVAAAVAQMPVAKDGRDGIDGKSVDMAEVVDMVTKAVALIPKPVDGKDGKDGEPGRDALELDVRRALDPLRRYHQGEVAAYRGGLIRSYRQTDAMPEGGSLEDHGWHVIQNGIDELAADLSEDGRRLGVAIRMTSGELVTKTIALPTTIYRGIWRDGDKYERGDQTTRDGSTWTLMAETQRGRPGDEGSGWELSAKRGNHGRDGNKGDKGERGAEGRAGRDATQLGPNGGKW